jgi:MYXO-CTERM domain-containing protein
MKILKLTLLISLGLLAIVSGEADDSPGLQGLGLILLVAVLIFAYRGRRQA